MIKVSAQYFFLNLLIYCSSTDAIEWILYLRRPWKAHDIWTLNYHLPLRFLQRNAVNYSMRIIVFINGSNSKSWYQGKIRSQCYNFLEMTENVITGDHDTGESIKWIIDQTLINEVFVLTRPFCIFVFSKSFLFPLHVLAIFLSRCCCVCCRMQLVFNF